MRTPEDQLNLRSLHPDFQKFLDINESESERVRNNYRCHLNQEYGKAALQTMDIFPAETANAPILIFIHGGYWRALDKGSYSFVAEPFIKNNFTVCVLNYRLIPTVNMKALLKDIQEALMWIQKNASQYNGDPDKLVLSGHSAGGHLAIMAYLMNESLRPRIKAICSLSGIFDLKPIKESYLNEVLQLDQSDVEKYSVTNKGLSVIKCPILLSVGASETNFFIEQSKDLYTKNRTLIPLHYFEYKGLNHYEIVHRLGQGESPISQFIFQQVESNNP